MNHVHRCACGTELRCAADIDKCAVFSNWTCPTCEQVALDDFYSTLVPAPINVTLEDLTRADHREDQ